VPVSGARRVFESLAALAHISQKPSSQFLSDSETDGDFQTAQERFDSIDQTGTLGLPEHREHAGWLQPETERRLSGGKIVEEHQFGANIQRQRKCIGFPTSKTQGAKPHE